MRNNQSNLKPMNRDSQTLDVGGIVVELVRKAIRGLRIGIYPPNGRVRVSAPKFASDQMVVGAVLARLGWIKKHQEKFLKQYPQSELQFVSGESHYFFGQKYKLQIIEHQGSRCVIVKNELVIELHVPTGFSQSDREAQLSKWYREQLRAVLPSMFEKWSKILGVEVNEWAIKKMKTRWGSCNTRVKRIWISLELAKHSSQCIEYVVVHELAHLLEPSHNERFKKIMTAAIPHWKLLREELKKKL